MAIVGVGKMGSALLSGVLQRGLLPAQEIGILDRDAARSASLSERFGVRHLELKDLSGVERVVISLQPGQFFPVSDQLAHPATGYLSTMAGVSTAALARHLGTRRVVRAMPSLAATIGCSTTAITAPREAVESGDYAFGLSLFGAVGEVYEIQESLFNVFTGMSSSGPAYVAVFAEALADGAVRMGLPRQLANSLVVKVLAASAELLAAKAHPAVLKDEVASPAGTTIAGLAELERYRFRAALIQAVEAATKRSLELGEDLAS